MNDLVFVMYNLNLNDKTIQKQSVGNEFSFENFPSDDEWVAQNEDEDLPKTSGCLRILDKNPNVDTSDEESEEENEDDDAQFLMRNVRNAGEGSSRSHGKRGVRINEPRNFSIIDEDERDIEEQEWRNDDDLDSQVQNEHVYGGHGDRRYEDDFYVRNEESEYNGDDDQGEYGFDASLDEDEEMNEYYLKKKLDEFGSDDE